MSRHEQVVQACLEELLRYRDQINADEHLRSCQVIIELDRGDVATGIRETTVLLKSVRSRLRPRRGVGGEV